MRIVLFAIVLAFPLLDFYATLRFARMTNVPAWVWLSVSALLGILVLRNERIAFRMKTVATMHGGESMLRGLLDSGRKVLAGLLLLLPGVLSDAIALILLALPMNIGREYGPLPAVARKVSGAGPGQ